MSMPEAFFTIHTGLPREGPGLPEDVRWALDLAATPMNARILDAGCGPGADTETILVARPSAHITAVDAHAPFIDDLAARLERHRARLSPVCGDMAEAEGPFDFIWSAGALYFLGLEQGLTTLAAKLSSGGAIAFSEPAYFVEAPSDAAVSFWEGYPTRPEGAVIDAAAAAGLEVLSARRLTDAAWEAYFAPIMARTARLRDGASAELLAQIEAAENECAAWRRVRKETGYLLVVARHA